MGLDAEDPAVSEKNAGTKNRTRDGMEVEEHAVDVTSN